MTSAQIHHDAAERLIHRDVGMPVACDPGLVAEGLADALAEHDAAVLDRVVEINVHIPIHREVEVDEPVAGKQRQHVIEERDASLDLRGPGSIKVDGQGDVGFARLSGTRRPALGFWHDG